MKKLLIPLMLIPFITSCGNQANKWKEISRDDAIKLEAQILNNFKAPKFYTSTMNAKFYGGRTWNGEAEAYSEKDMYYKSANATPGEIGSMMIKVDYLRVWDNQLWEFISEDEVLRESGWHFKSENMISETNALQILKETILESYLREIVIFESYIATAIDCKKKQEAGVKGYEGSYSFYSKDSASLKGEFSYTIPHGESKEDDETANGVLQFERNLPRYMKQERHYEELNDSRELTFNYKKHPNKIPEDLKPGEWDKD